MPAVRSLGRLVRRGGFGGGDVHRGQGAVSGMQIRLGDALEDATTQRGAFQQGDVGEPERMQDLDGGVAEAGPVQDVGVVLDRQGACEQAEPGRQRLMQRWGEGAQGGQVGDGELAARGEDPPGFRGDAVFGRGQADGAVGDDQVDAGVLDGEVFDRPPDGTRRWSGRRRRRAGWPARSSRGHVDPDDPPRGSDAASAHQGVQTPAGAEVQHRHSGPQLDQGGWVGAASDAASAPGQASSSWPYSAAANACGSRVRLAWAAAP